MTTYKANNGLEFIILQQTGKQCIIQFLGTGSVRKANIDNIKAGKVRDLYAKTSYGVGFLGEYARNGYHVSAQQLWRNMIKRCYTDDPKGYKAKGTTVDPRWHCFASFLEDLPTLPNFQRWVNKEGYQLDKDLKIPGSNVYSKETCSFVTEQENKSAGKAGKRLVGGEWVTTIS
jgi:hypothetical protein